MPNYPHYMSTGPKEIRIGCAGKENEVNYNFPKAATNLQQKQKLLQKRGQLKNVASSYQMPCQYKTAAERRYRNVAPNDMKRV